MDKQTLRKQIDGNISYYSVLKIYLKCKINACAFFKQQAPKKPKLQ